jgi:hypothetical protein
VRGTPLACRVFGHKPEAIPGAALTVSTDRAGRSVILHAIDRRCARCMAVLAVDVGDAQGLRRHMEAEIAMRGPAARWPARWPPARPGFLDSWLPRLARLRPRARP